MTNILNLDQIERIYEMTTPRWVSSEQLHNMGGQLKIAYITPELGIEVQHLKYYLNVKDKRTYENGKVEYFVEFVDW